MSFDPTSMAAAAAVGAGVGYLLGCINVVTRSATANHDDLVVCLRSPANAAARTPAMPSGVVVRSALDAWNAPVAVRPSFTLPKLVVKIDDAPTNSWGPPVAELRSNSCEACRRSLRARHRFCPDCGLANSWER